MKKISVIDCIKMAKYMGIFTIIVYEQEIYEIGFALRMQCMEQYSNVVLHLGGFYCGLTSWKQLWKSWKDTELKIA